MGTSSDTPTSPDTPVAWQDQSKFYGLPLFGHQSCIFGISEPAHVTLIPRSTVESASTCSACGLQILPTPLLPLPADSLEELVARLTTVTAQHVAIHHRSIDDAWGTFALTGETYRGSANRDWRQAQTALLSLQQQAAGQPPLLNRRDLETVTECARGMHIRLTQRFAEGSDDPALATDEGESARLWEHIQALDLALYQRLG